MTGNSKRWLPAAAVVLAVAAMAITARHDGPIDRGPGDGLWLGARPAMVLAALVALIVIAVNFAKRRDDGYGVLHRAGTATALLLIAAAVLTPIGLAILGQKPAPPGGQQLKPAPTTAVSRRRPSAGGASGGGPHNAAQRASHLVIMGLLAIILAVAVALLVYLLIRLLSRRWFPRDARLVLEFDPLAAELEDLTDAVAAGTEALEYEGDAREAVIACYAAMEQAVSAGGSGRRSTDTPEEFLRRVTVANLIPEGPAARLTELFREARFSRHPISEAKRVEARDALREISDHVRTRAAELAAANAAAAGQAAARAAAATPAAGRMR